MSLHERVEIRATLPGNGPEVVFTVYGVNRTQYLDAANGFGRVYTERLFVRRGLPVPAYEDVQVVTPEYDLPKRKTPHVVMRRNVEQDYVF